MHVDPDTLVALGVVTRPHGVRGELRVHLFNPDSDLLQSVGEVILRAPDASLPPRRMSVKRARSGPKKVLLLSLGGVGSHEAADALRGHEVCVPREALPEAGPDEHYVIDLIGLQVQRRDGSPIGTVLDVIAYPSVDCLVIGWADEQVEVPMVDPWLVDIDPALGVVVVDGVEDLPRERRGRAY